MVGSGEVVYCVDIAISASESSSLSPFSHCSRHDMWLVMDQALMGVFFVEGKLLIVSFL